MRVLNINKFHYLRAGTESYYFALTKLLEENGHDVIPFSMHDRRNIKSDFAKYFVSHLELSRPNFGMVKFAGRTLWFREAQKKITKLIEETHPDIAHIHLLYHHISPSILPVIKKYGIPIVMTLHDYKLICPNYSLYTNNETCTRCKGGKYYEAVKNKCLKNSYAVSCLGAMEMYFHKFIKVYEKNVDMFIAPSQFVKNIHVDFGQNPEKITVIPHFIDPKFIEQGRKVNASSTKPFMLYFGRLAVEKGVDKILKMMYIYKSCLPLKIAGQGPLEQYLKDYIAMKDLEGRVEMLGHLSKDELIEQIKQAQVVVMPSQFYEPFGLAAIETMALGTPLVVARSGALPEIIPDDMGRLFDKEDLSEMFEAIEEVRKWDKKDLMQKSKKLFTDKFTKEQHFESLLEVYNSVR